MLNLCSTGAKLLRSRHSLTYGFAYSAKWLPCMRMVHFKFNVLIEARKLISLEEDSEKDSERVRIMATERIMSLPGELSSFPAQGKKRC